MDITLEYQYTDQSGGPDHPDNSGGGGGSDGGGQCQIKYFQIIKVTSVLGTCGRILHDLYVHTLCVY